MPMLSNIKDRQKANDAAKKALRKELALESQLRQDSALAQKKKAQKKRRKKTYLWIVGGLVFLFLAYLLFKPFQKNMTYGICKVFVQLYVPFPYTLHYSEAYDFDTSVRIWFAHLDAYGDYQLQRAECFFRPDETYGAALDRVTINRREIDPEVIEDFNRSIPVILEYPPDLQYPDPLPRSIDELQFDFDRYRRQIL